jgi:acetyltransferase
MARTRVYKLLQGFRDRPPAALDEIASVLLKVSQLIIDFGEIAELDINPLLADAGGVVALDARIRVQRFAGPATARLAIRPYPSELEQEIARPGEADLLLRPILPEDEPQLVATFAALSPETVRRRFFSGMRQLRHGLAARLTQIDYDREMALVLTTPGPAGRQPIHGVVRIAADPDGERAEYAVIVRDELAGRGLGRLLMERILDYARSRGIGEVFGYVQADNERMLRLCTELGFSRAHPADRPGEVVVVRSLRAAAD